MQTRRATIDDLHQMQHCNLRCLPENYSLRYYLYHYLSWPQLTYIQEDINKNVVGYVLGKMDDEDDEDKSKCHGHITSLATLRTHRKLGVATKVMNQTMREMEHEWEGNFCSLHVRRTNAAALHLYQDTLQYRCANIDFGYYVDDEDAYHMKKYFKGKENPGGYVQDGKLVYPKGKEPKEEKKKEEDDDDLALSDDDGIGGKSKGKSGGKKPNKKKDNKSKHADPNEGGGGAKSGGGKKGGGKKK